MTTANATFSKKIPVILDLENDKIEKYFDGAFTQVEAREHFNEMLAEKSNRNRQLVFGLIEVVDRDMFETFFDGPLENDLDKKEKEKDKKDKEKDKEKANKDSEDEGERLFGSKKKNNSDSDDEDEEESEDKED